MGRVREKVVGRVGVKREVLKEEEGDLSFGIGPLIFSLQSTRSTNGKERRRRRGWRRVDPFLSFSTIKQQVTNPFESTSTR